MEKNRLTAIMFSDIVGFTRKMGEDEARMLRLLNDHNAIVEGAVGNHDGEIIKRMGDAFLVSFDSALNAVLCAVDIQQAHADYNRDKPLEDQVQVRIGIHLGDIVIREDDVFGDGVNVASRVEPLAHPGGICITRSVYDIVKRRMEIKAVELGPQQLKNVNEAVEVFHLLSDTVGLKELRRTKQWKKRRSPARYVLLLAIVLVLVFAVWRQFLSGSDGVSEFVQQLQRVEISENRVAVLPLRNLTGSEDRQYICEGIAEELIFRLSGTGELYAYPLSEVLAISENNRTAEGIRRALGVKYLVQGSVQEKRDSLLVVLDVINTETLDRLS
ncbi:MAG: pH-sensitive adenylate cyclase [Calditrichaeota bacterium]|nr:pH-sensitive adenylate cyclase [Calditrichota bacterium]